MGGRQNKTKKSTLASWRRYWARPKKQRERQFGVEAVSRDTGPTPQREHSHTICDKLTLFHRWCEQCKSPYFITVESECMDRVASPYQCDVGREEVRSMHSVQQPFLLNNTDPFVLFCFVCCLFVHRIPFSLLRLCLSNLMWCDVTCLMGAICVCVYYIWWFISLLLLSRRCSSSYILQSTHYILEYVVCNDFSVQILSFFYILN